MTKNKLLIYLLLFTLIATFSGCEKAELMPQSTPTASAEITLAPTPTPTPSPTPKKFDANIVNIPDEAAVDAMEFEDIEDTPFFVEVTNTEDVVLVEFWSESVTYCAVVSETLVALSENTGVKVVRVNVDENPTLADDYGLVVLPSVYVFLDGVQVNAVLGQAPYEDYEEMIHQYR